MKRNKSRGISEAETRRRLIDHMITHAGWGSITDYDEMQKYTDETVIEYQTANGHVDYALFYDGKPLALVEAKRLSVGPQNVLKQAQRYARGLPTTWWEFGEYRVPFIYSTNGEVIWFQDLRHPNSRSRIVKQFHTPEALVEMLTRGDADACSWLIDNSKVGKERLREYQRDAVEAIEKELCKGKRKMMVAMATGTGKTFTAISLLYRLMKSGFAKKILFLVDRRALAAQAAGSMSVYEPESGLKFDKIYEVYSQKFKRGEIDETKFDVSVLPNHYLTNPDPNHTFAYVCTIQRMRINLFGLPGEESETGDVHYHVKSLVNDVHQIQFACAFGRALEKRGFPAGDKAILNTGLPEFIMNGSLRTICTYFSNLWPEDGCFSIEYPRNIGYFTWDRSVVVREPTKEMEYGFTSVVTDDHLSLFEKYGTRVEEDLKNGFKEELYLTPTTLDELIQSMNPNVSSLAKELKEIVLSNRSRLLDDEIEALRRTGVHANQVFMKLTYHIESSRVSISRRGKIYRKKDVMRTALQMLPDDIRKSAKVEEWMNLRPELRREVERELAGQLT